MASLRSPIEGGVTVTEFRLKRIYAEAEPGDTVLLAPAAASFDQFPDFEKRGEAFIAAVAALDPG